MAQRARREYLQFLDAAKRAAETAIEAFNAVRRPYRVETTLLLFTNAWELLAKAVLLQKKQSIAKGQRGDTISAEVAIHRLIKELVLTRSQVDIVQQLVSLRHAACHQILPPVPVEVMQHLLFYCSKFFRETVEKQFQGHAKDLQEHYLSMSFSELTTYADKVQKAVSKIKRNNIERKLVWLLERGIQFDGESYITEAQFTQKYHGKKRILPHLKLSEFVRTSDMVRIVPIEAPRNFTADVTLRKGSAADASLPVIVKKTEIEADYPYLTGELGTRIGKNQNWVAKAIQIMNLKGDPKYHQPVRAGAKTVIHRYSAAAEAKLRAALVSDPSFDPYNAK